MSARKIIFKVPEFPHVSETFIVAQIACAISLGYDIKILVRSILSEEDTESPLIRKLALRDKVIIENYNIPRSRFFRIVKWISLVISNIMYISAIIKYHKFQQHFSLTWLYQWHFYSRFRDISIFHVQYGTNTSPLVALKRTGSFNFSLIVTFHGHDAFFPINGFINNDGYYDDLFTLANIIITANTNYLADVLYDLGCPSEKLKIIPVGVDIEFFRPNTEKRISSCLSLITIGRLDKVKGQQYAIEVVEKLAALGVKVNLTIVGEGMEKENIEELITTKKMQSRIKMVGKKSQIEVRQLLWEHDIYLLMSVALPNGHRETQGLATLEAQACGLPAVVYDSGGVASTVLHNVSGFVCPEGEIETVCKNIIKLADCNMRMKMSVNATNFVVKNFSTEIVKQTWAKIYRDAFTRSTR